VFGEGKWVAYGLNAAAGAILVVPLYVLGGSIDGRAGGAISAVLGALSPSFVFWSPVLLSETLFTLLLASAGAVVLTGRGPPTTGRLMAFGVLVGLAALTHGPAIVIVPVAAFYWRASGAGSSAPPPCGRWST
jgi:4-amino-4-deoxy-L-arabinose transferase-like glycosyltransferase